MHKVNIAKAFTLVELLVVISIIAMLTSVVIANVESARAKSRDAVRVQQIRQIDLATQLYKQDKGNAPYLGGCAARASNKTASQLAAAASACFAVSTAAVNSPEGLAWQAYKDDLKDYIQNIPNDPCPSCSSDLGYMGYTYIPPLALQYQCALDDQEAEGADDICPLSQEALDDMYGLYAPLEEGTGTAGNTGSGTARNIANNFGYGTGGADTTAPVISNVFAGSDSSGESGYIQWTTNENTKYVVQYGLFTPDMNFTEYFSSSVANTNYFSIPVQTDPGIAYIYKIIATDSSGNQSQTEILNFYSYSPLPGGTQGTGSGTNSGVVPPGGRDSSEP